jgi:transposase
MLIIAEVGEIDRFPDARHLCAWAGLTPTVRSSDGKARLGPHLSPRLAGAALDLMDGASLGRDSLAASSSPNRRRRPD